MTTNNVAQEMSTAFTWLREFLPKTPWFSEDKSPRRYPLKKRLTDCALNVKKLVSEYPRIARLLQKCFEDGGEPYDIALLLFLASERSSDDVASMLSRAGFNRKALLAMAQRIRTTADDIEKFNSPRLPGLWSHATFNQPHEIAEKLKVLPAVLRFYADAVADWPPPDWRQFSAKEGRNYEAVYLHLYLKKFGGVTWPDFEDLLDFADDLRGSKLAMKDEAARKRITRFAKNNAQLFEGMKKDIDEYAVRNEALKRQGAKRKKYFPHVLHEILH